MADFYALLGVDRTADAEALKKAYKKQAMKWHPDRWASKPEAEKKVAEETFKRVSEAFAVLSDPTQKQIYDAYGEEGLKQGAPPPPAADTQGGAGGVPFGGAGGVPFGGAFGSGGPSGGPRMYSFSTGGPGGGGGMSAEDAERLFASMFGGGGGGGGFGGFGFDTSGGMSGGGMDGFNNKRARAVGPTISAKLPCSLEEFARGAKRKFKVQRQDWDAARGVPIQGEPTLLEIEIKPGMKAGTRMTFAGSGNAGPGGRGDVIFELVEKAHGKSYKREENDLVVPVRLSLEQALCGHDAQVPDLCRSGSGSYTSVPIDRVIKPGDRVSVPNLGFPIRKGGVERGRGNAILEFNVNFPTRLSAEQKERVRDALQRK